MARNYKRTDYQALRREELRRSLVTSGLVTAGVFGAALSPLLANASPTALMGLGFLPAAVLGSAAYTLAKQQSIERERRAESG